MVQVRILGIRYQEPFALSRQYNSLSVIPGWLRPPCGSEKTWLRKGSEINIKEISVNKEEA